MAKKSQLSEKQWKEIEQRFLRGESARALAKVFGVPESTIRSKFSARTAQIKDVANQVIKAEEAFYSLPAPAQVSAQSLINELRSVSIHLAGAARYGSMTAHRLAGIANQQVEKIDDANPTNEDGMELIRGIAALTEVANKSAQTGINLLNANKETINKANEEPVSKAATMDDKTKAAKLAGIIALAKNRVKDNA